MTEQLLKDPAWRRRNRLCTFLSLLPGFGWTGFLFMAKRSGRKTFRTAAAVYGVLSTAVLLLLGMHMCLEYLHTNVLQYINAYCLSLLPVLWISCLVHTMALSNQYLQFLALRQSASPERDPLTADKHWRQENLYWMIWSFLPLLGGFSTWTIGRRLKKRGVALLGLLSMLVVAALYILELVDYWFYDAFVEMYKFLETTVYSAVSFWVINLIVSFLYREDYLDLRVAAWKKDTRSLPKLLERSWRLRNSLWQIWTLFPVVGGIGISIAGVRGRNRKHAVAGLIFCLISAFLFVASFGGRDLFERVGLQLPRIAERFIEELLDVLIPALYLVVFYYGTSIRWDVLRGRASALQGYGSEFERELDLQNRLRARGLDIPGDGTQPNQEVQQPQNQESAPEVQQSTPEHIRHRPLDTPVEPVSQQVPGEKIDVNRCSQSELMELPGIGVVQAKRAIEHRQTHGGFRSVDEFVDLLQIKPHFAVQIFAMANAGQAETPADKTDSGQPAIRRQIDF